MKILIPFLVFVLIIGSVSAYLVYDNQEGGDYYNLTEFDYVQARIGNFTNIIGNGTQLTDLNHSLQDAYDDGSIIQVDDDDVTWNLSSDSDITWQITSNFPTAEAVTADYLTLINLSIDTSGAGSKTTYFKIIVSNETIFQIGQEYSSVIGYPERKRTYGATIIESAHWVPLEDNVYDLGYIQCAGARDNCGDFTNMSSCNAEPGCKWESCFPDCSVCVRSDKDWCYGQANDNCTVWSGCSFEYNRWKDLYLAGTIKGTGSGETLFMNASTGEVRFANQSFNVSEDGNLTMEGSQAVGTATHTGLNPGDINWSGTAYGGCTIWSNGNLTCPENVSAGGYLFITGRTGIGTSSPDARLELLDTTHAQLRMTYQDSVHYAEFEVNPANLKISATGGIINFDDDTIYTTGKISNYADDAKHTWGASGATDSYIQFNGANLQYYSSGIHDFGSGVIATTTNLSDGTNNITIEQIRQTYDGNFTDRNISTLNYFNATGDLEWIKPENILDVDDEDVEGDFNTYWDIGGDGDTGAYEFTFPNSNFTMDNLTVQIVYGRNFTIERLSTTELVSDGNFSAGADSIWTLGTGWTYDGVPPISPQVAIFGGLIGVTGSLTQTISITAGHTYKLTYTRTQTNEHTITPSCGGVTLTTSTAAGTYTEDFTATSTADLNFTATSTHDIPSLKLDNVSVKRIFQTEITPGQIKIEDLILSSGSITDETGQINFSSRIRIENQTTINGSLIIISPEAKAAEDAPYVLNVTGAVGGFAMGGGDGGGILLTGGTGGAGIGGGDGGDNILTPGAYGIGSSVNGSYGNVILAKDGGNVYIGTPINITSINFTLQLNGSSYFDGVFNVTGTGQFLKGLTTLSDELLDDPEFDGSMGTTWENQSGGWIMAAGHLHKTGAPATAGETNPFTVKANAKYVCTVDVVSCITAILSAQLGGHTIEIFDADEGETKEYSILFNTINTEPFNITASGSGDICNLSSVSIREANYDSNTFGETTIFNLEVQNETVVKDFIATGDVEFSALEIAPDYTETGAGECALCVSAQNVLHGSPGIINLTTGNRFDSGGSGGHFYITTGNGSEGGNIYLTTGIGSNFYGFIILARYGGNIGIRDITPDYPLDIEANTSEISIWAQSNISAAGYNTHSFSDIGYIGTLETFKIKSLPSPDEILDSEGKLNMDYTFEGERFVHTRNESIMNETGDIIGYKITEIPLTRIDAVAFNNRLMVAELKAENRMLKDELCARDNTYSWCKEVK